MNCLRKCAVLVMFISPLSMAEVLVNELLSCSETENSLRRLVCYDELVKDVKSNQYSQKSKSSAPTKLPSPKDVTVKQPIKALPKKIDQQRANFGRENKQRADEFIKQIKAQVVDVTKSARGKYIVTLDNGQVWQQTGSNKFRLKKADVVVVTRGALGSFFIGKENLNKRIRAKRVK